MNTDSTLAHEIRLLRRTVLICSAFLFVGLCTAVVFLVHDRPVLAVQPPPEKVQMDPLMDAKQHPFDRDKAFAAAQEFISRYPDGYYGYSYLGQIYLSTGDMAKAEANYSRSFTIAPLHETRLRLTAIRKRLGMQPPKE